MEAVFVHLALSIFGQRMLASSHQFDLLYFSTIFQFNLYLLSRAVFHEIKHFFQDSCSTYILGRPQEFSSITSKDVGRFF